MAFWDVRKSLVFCFCFSSLIYQSPYHLDILMSHFYKHNSKCVCVCAFTCNVVTCFQIMLILLHNVCFRADSIFSSIMYFVSFKLCCCWCCCCYCCFCCWCFTVMCCFIIYTQAHNCRGLLSVYLCVFVISPSLHFSLSRARERARSLLPLTPSSITVEWMKKDVVDEHNLQFIQIREELFSSLVYIYTCDVGCANSFNMYNLPYLTYNISYFSR